MAIYEIEGSLKDRIIEILLDQLGPRIEMWQAESIADAVIETLLGE